MENPDDSAGVALWISRLLADSALTGALAAETRRAAVQRFSLARRAAALGELYREVFEIRGRPGDRRRALDLDRSKSL